MANDLTLSLKIDLSKFNGSLDEAKKALLGVEGTHNVKVEADPKNALDGLSKIGNALTGLWASVQMVKGAWNNTVGSWVANAQDSVRAYKLVEQGIVATGGAAGYTAEELAGISEELMKMSNYDDDEIMEKLTSPLLTFRNIAGPTFKEAQMRALDLSTVLHQDLQSSAIQLGKALNDPIQGATALRRVGIQLTEQQEQQVKSFMAVNDIVSAQRVILDGVAEQIKGQAQATADPIKQMAVAFGNVGEALGKVLLPYINEFARLMTGSVIPFIQNDFMPAVKSVVEFFKEWGIVIAGVLIGALSGYIVQLGIANAATLKLIFSTAGLTGAFKSLWAVLNSNAIFLLITSIGFLVSQFMKAIDITGSWTNALWVLAFGMTRISLTVINFSRAIVESLLWVIKSGFNPFMNVISAISDAIMLLLSGNFKEAGKRITSGIIDGISSTQTAINDSLSNMWSKITKDPLYDEMGKALYNKVNPGQKILDNKDETVQSVKDMMNEINSVIGSAGAGSTGSSSGSSTNNHTMKFRQAKPSGGPDINYNDIDTEQIRKQQAEALDLYKEFYDQQDYIEKSSYDLQKQHINEFYAEHRQTWLAMGITEEEIERQRQARLIESSQAFQGVMSSIESGFDAAVDGITDKSLSLHERWDKVWQAMGKTALKALADILKQQIVNLAKTMFFHRAETASHIEKETTKTAVTQANMGFRLGALLVESTKEIAIAVATSVKFVATQIYKVGASLMAWFTSTFGPFGIPMAIASTAGAAAAINALRKGFRTGGWTGEGSDDEEAGVVHKNEIVFESAIAKKYKSAIMNFRSALQSGVNPLNFAGPQLAFAGGGSNADMGRYFKGIEDKLDILNRNLVEKDLSVNINNKIDSKSITRAIDKQKASMKSRGYNDRSAN